MTDERNQSDLALYRRLLFEARQYWPHMVGLFALGLLSTPLTLGNPLPLKIIVDSVLGPHELPTWLAWSFPASTQRSDWSVVLLVAGLIILLALAKQLLDLLSAVIRSYTGEQLVLTLRAKLFGHIQRLSLSHHDGAGTGSSTYRIQYDAPAIQWIIIDCFIPLASSLLTLSAMIVVIARINWSLALVALMVVPTLYVVSQIYNRQLKLQWHDAKNIESSMLSIVQEVLSSMRVVKAFVQEDREQQRYVQRARRNLRKQTKLALTGGSFGLIVGLIMAIGSAGVLCLGVRAVRTGDITLGDLILVMSYLALLYTPLHTISLSVSSLQGSLISAERVFELLDRTPDVMEKPRARSLVRALGRVEFENVCFEYNATRSALRGISFSIDAGSCVGIAGATGAGKSTLVNLLLRFYDPTGGYILLDGADLRDYRLRDLRNQFAVVLQDPVLFSTSIIENIAYARPDATEKEIIDAAQAANAHEFIRSLPQGYETSVGERGVQLSGGERQRISLARAFVKNAPILILDEPTSSVDVRTEVGILEAITRLKQGRTTFMIAHRLTTLAHCNVLLVLEHGLLQTITPDVSTALRNRLVVNACDNRLSSDHSLLN